MVGSEDSANAIIEMMATDNSGPYAFVLVMLLCTATIKNTYISVSIYLHNDVLILLTAISWHSAVHGTDCSTTYLTDDSPRRTHFLTNIANIFCPAGYISTIVA